MVGVLFYCMVTVSLSGVMLVVVVAHALTCALLLLLFYGRGVHHVGGTVEVVLELLALVLLDVVELVRVTLEYLLVLIETLGELVALSQGLGVELELLGLSTRAALCFHLILHDVSLLCFLLVGC